MQNSNNPNHKHECYHLLATLTPCLLSVGETPGPILNMYFISEIIENTKFTINKPYVPSCPQNLCQQQISSKSSHNLLRCALLQYVPVVLNSVAWTQVASEVYVHPLTRFSVTCMRWSWMEHYFLQKYKDRSHTSLKNHTALTFCNIT
jgi:hypothetical protein